MGPLQLAQIQRGVNAPNFDHLVFLEMVIFEKCILETNRTEIYSFITESSGFLCSITP